MPTEALIRNMTTGKIVEFRGTLRVITPDGQSGLVVLDDEVAGAKYAVVSPDTDGREAIMNGTGLKKNTRVSGEGEAGTDALLAVSIQKIN
jgi:hypothetical protein